MAIQAPVSSPNAPVAPTAAPLAPGDRIDARVVGPGADGLVRLATAAGLIDVDLPATLPAGSRASFIVQSVGATLTLALIAATAKDPAVASAPQAPAATPGASLPTVLQAVRQAALAGQDGPAPLLALLAQITPSTPLPVPLRDAAAALSAFGLSAAQLADPEALASAVGRSGLFGEARAAAGRPVITDLKSALAAVLVTATAWRPAPAGADITGPAPATTTGPVPSPTEAPADPGLPIAGNADATTVPTGEAAGARPLRVDGAVVRQPSAPVEPAADRSPLALPVPAAGGQTRRPDGAAAGLAPSATQSDGALPVPATAMTGLGNEPASAPLPGLVPSRVPVDGVPRAERASDGRLPGQDPGAASDGPAVSRVPVETARPGPALALLAQLLGRSQDEQSAPSLTQTPAAQSRPPPPQADRATAPPIPVPDRVAELPPDLPAGVLRATVIERTEAVLDRIVLSQLASLPAEVTVGQPAGTGQPAPQSTAQGPAQNWVMDLPLRLPGETTAAQLRVSRDGSRGAEGVDAPKGWTVDFALDTTATGPVHARLRLGGPVLGVTLWAERPATLVALQDAAPDLRRALDEAAFSVETISVLSGAPRQPRPARPGSLVDARS